ncbi:MAG TPA: hypothetical protein VHT91_42610 [Kofleriaceae bacterium]|jgi:hypothetical protein|nr:hypothetical protein [Kofleriaceae bacterium]
MWWPPTSANAELLERRRDDREGRGQTHDRQHVVARIELRERLHAVLERGVGCGARPGPELGDEVHAEHAAEHLVGALHRLFECLLPVEVLRPVCVVGPYPDTHVADPAVPVMRALERAGRDVLGSNLVL